MKYKNTFKDILTVLENNSTCARLKVSSIIVKDDRIISMGWNGVPSGHKHCEDIFKDPDFSDKDLYHQHHIFANENELHAEQNAISFAAKNGIKTDGASLYVSISPCDNCAKLIIAAGIKNVFYKKVYDRSSVGLLLLKKSNINCVLIGD